jgi:hypothetical protein
MEETFSTCKATWRTFQLLMIKVLVESGDYRKSSNYVFSCLLNHGGKDFFLQLKETNPTYKNGEGLLYY